MIEKKEIVYFILSSLVIGYLFSFKGLLTGGGFVGWLQLSGLAFITVFLSSLACEFAASKFGCDAEFNLWTMRLKGYGLIKKSRFRKVSLKVVPVWILLPLILIFLTWGFVKWVALMVFDAVPAARLEKEYHDLTEWELALIALAGPFVSLLLAIISQFFGWTVFMSMNLWYAFFNLLPISELNGAKIASGSKLLWAFVFTFTTAILILLGIADITTTIVAAVLLGLIGLVVVYWFYEKGI